MKQLKTLILAAGLALCAALCGAVPAMAQNPDRVRVADGVLEGLGRQPSGVREFRGVPFAAPPVGPLRWREPQPVKPWPGVREAKAFGPRCMQAPVFSDMVFRSPGISEDCLYLNVWTPAASARARLPVLVYFYGGGYIAGDGSELRYDGESMAGRGMVVVTLNYRLGVFGFFAHPELSATSPHHASGDQGLLDQAAALQWVQRNIAAFGGDPAHVTIAGESAGSWSVSAHMASPLSKGRFAGAIGESGSDLGLSPIHTLSEAESQGSAFGARLGAKSLAELQALPADRLLQAQGTPGAILAEIVIDGWFMPRQPTDIFAAGEQAQVPLLAGSNTQEWPAQALVGNGPPTVEAYRAALRQHLGDKADAIFQAYPASGDGDPVLAAAQSLASDWAISFATWRWMDLATRTGGRPTFYYLYAQPRPATRAAPDAPRPAGAVHSAEIEYALGNLDTNQVYAWTPDDRRTSEAMQTYFANFIKTGDPNGPGLPQWPHYQSGLVMRLSATPKAEPDTARPRREALMAAMSAPH